MLFVFSFESNSFFLFLFLFGCIPTDSGEYPGHCTRYAVENWDSMVRILLEQAINSTRLKL